MISILVRGLLGATLYAITATVVTGVAVHMGMDLQPPWAHVALTALCCGLAFFASTRSMKSADGPSHGDRATREMLRRVAVLVVLGLGGIALGNVIYPPFWGALRGSDPQAVEDCISEVNLFHGDDLDEEGSLPDYVQEDLARCSQGADAFADEVRGVLNTHPRFITAWFGLLFIVTTGYAGRVKRSARG